MVSILKLIIIYVYLIIGVNLHNASVNITVVYYLLMILASVPCPGENWSRCKIGKQCVPMEKWCDYKVDCMDGSDEKNCGKFYIEKNY